VQDEHLPSAAAVYTTFAAARARREAAWEAAWATAWSAASWASGGMAARAAMGPAVWDATSPDKRAFMWDAPEVDQANRTARAEQVRQLAQILAESETLVTKETQR